jgi:putative hydroxymethylpyrimidine transport system substrate-binding protein
MPAGKITMVWVTALVAVAALLTGCGAGGADAGDAQDHSASRTQEPSGPRKLRVSLDNIEGPENAAILMAIERGYFEDVGLDVWAGSPLEPSRPAQYVAKGIDDFGVTQMPQVAVANEKGASVVAVGSLVPHPTASMIWLKGSGIRGIADLEGKTIGTAGVPFQKGFLETILARAGLTLDDVQVRGVGYELVPDLLSGSVDAIFGGSWNLEGAELESLGEKPAITGARELGLPDYEEFVVIARRDLVAKDPHLVRDFMTAVKRGAAATAEDPKAAVDAIVKSIGAVPELHRKEREAQMRATLPLLSRSGRMSPARTQELVAWMHRHGLIQAQPPVSELLTDEYLASP